MVDLHRHASENEYQFIWRLSQAKDCGLLDMTWDELADIFNDELREDGEEWTQSAYRKPYQQAKTYYDEVFAKMIDGTYSDNIVELRDELFKAKQQYFDQRREYNALLREEARFEHLEDTLRNEVSKLDSISFEPREIEPEAENDAVLLLSDIHYGLVVDSVLSYYDCSVAEDRLRIVCEKAVAHCKKHDVKTLHVVMLGDLISGIIKIQHQIAAEEDVVTQSLNAAEILSRMIEYMDSNIENVKLYGVYGNHARITPDKKKQVKSENFERVVYNYIQFRTGKTVLQNGLEDWLTFDIDDKKIFVSHGDEDSISNVRNHAINLCRYVPDVIYIGHTHHLQVNDENGTEVVVNGSLLSTDDYAMKLRAITKPYQVMHVFSGNDDYIIKIMAE